ncbi:MAG: NAD(P)H dehydrogenase assembly family protein [Cyanobacteriota bacterium]|nr:NAD(P)H dehydrogenase assembly family protein [Cyanobacteriota bacterium]
MSPSATPGPSPPIGARVRLNDSVPYLKTADPMPMLRPPDLVDPAEIGVVVEQRARDQLAVRFRRGTFLLSASALQSVLTPEEGEH